MSTKAIQVLQLFYAEELRAEMSAKWDDEGWLDVKKESPPKNSLVYLKLRDMTMVKAFYLVNRCTPPEMSFLDAPHAEGYYPKTSIIAWMLTPEIRREVE